MLAPSTMNLRPAEAPAHRAISVMSLPVRNADSFTGAVISTEPAVCPYAIESNKGSVSNADFMAIILSNFTQATGLLAGPERPAFTQAAVAPAQIRSAAQNRGSGS